MIYIFLNKITLLKTLYLIFDRYQIGLAITITGTYLKKKKFAVHYPSEVAPQGLIGVCFAVMQPFETTDEIFKNVSVSFIWILQWLKITSHQRAFWFHFVSTYFIRAPIQPNAPSSLFLMSRISPLHSGHCSAMAHRASSSAPWVSGSGSERHWTSLLRIFLSQPSSRIRMVIHGCARTQLPKAWRLSLHSSAASSHLSSQVRLTFIGPGAELESKAPRRKRRAVEKKRF